MKIYSLDLCPSFASRASHQKLLGSEGKVESFLTGWVQEEEVNGENKLERGRKKERERRQTVVSINVNINIHWKKAENRKFQ